MFKQILTVIFTFLLPGLYLSAQTITIYQNNYAVVNETRDFNLTKGVNHLSLKNPGNSILPFSFNLSFKNKKTIEIIEKKFLDKTFDLHTLFNYYQQEPIKIHLKSGEIITGQILSIAGGQLFILLPDSSLQVVAQSLTERFEFPGIPPETTLYPGIELIVSSRKKGTYQANINYILKGFNWQVKYKADLNTDTEEITIHPEIMINNTTPFNYSQAMVNLIAGKLYLPENISERPVYERSMIPFAAKSAGSTTESGKDNMTINITEQPILSYYHFSLDKPLDLPPGSNTMVTLYQPFSLPVKLIYILQSNLRNKEIPLETELRFVLEKTPEHRVLPAGKIYVYGRTETAVDKFLGGAFIKESLPGDTLKIRVGKSFNITAKRLLLQRFSDTKRRYDGEKRKIILKNKSEQSVLTEIYERIPPNANIESASHQYERESADLIRFKITLSPQARENIVYSFKRKW